ncbi:MAG: hypothetical protein JST82_02680 [Bacteroidetes bacterium]|nr:hypothetical protein [Bacteroidota bacterium]
MKNKTIALTAALITAFTITIISCKKEKTTSDTNTTETTVLTPYEILLPTRFPELVIPDDNKPYEERIQLGRELYYDPILSNDGRSCASCHIQSQGFTISEMKYDMPVLPHINLGWYSNFMWDGSKQGTLEDVMQFETRDFFSTDLAKMNSSSKYKALFKKCFGVDNITHKEIGYALAQFTRTLISGDSKYDRYLSGAIDLTPFEKKGMEIFYTEKGDCFHCHTNVMYTDNLFHNTGVDSIYAKEADKGYYNVTKNILDLGKFKTPNLRNVALRTHFMHDGRYTSLDEVVEFYNNGVRKVSNLDPIMTKPGKINGLKLTAEDKAALIAFLKTLTDTTFLNNTALGKPE